ncbi:MAG: hypothetical protein PVG39_10905 [Desulfobacteraceae bacterium]|jgi:type IV pilus assembly protein PilQ
MSKLNCIDKKRRFHSFLIYIFVAACFLFGCATKSSVEMSSAEDVDSQTNIDQVNTDYSRNDTVQEEKPIAEAADKKAETGAAESEAADIGEKEYTESEPRIFIKPSDSKLGQILGIDFTMMPQGKSRLTVTTNKDVSYDLDSVNANTLSLNIYNSKIGNEILLRHIDTADFQTPLEKIQPVFDKDNNKVSLGITMREVVPYTIKQSDNSLIIDFDRIKSKIAERKIVPLNLVEAETKNLAAVAEPRAASQPSSVSQARPQTEIQAFSPSVSRKYTGKPMYLEFSKATDVTDILTMINDVSGENIIWDPAIKGKKVSMILKDEPWDYAFELVLMLADLAKRQVGENTIFVTTKDKMAQILAEEESEARKLEQKLEQEREKIIEQKKRIEDNSPLITEYIPIDFAKADEIKEHIILTPNRGKISVETNTNTIIMTDTENSIEEAKKIISKFDVPVKQIMIEARIVDATENFSRDLGLKWNSDTSFWRVNTNTDYTLPADAVDFEVGGQRAAGGSFSTNSPEGWASNIGLNFAKASGDGMGRITLDAALAVAENEGTAKVMSAPKVTAREGSSATISSGDKIIIPATENVQSTTLDATLSLTVTPVSVSFNNYITLEVDVTDDQAPTTTRILKKAINTTLMVKSGETVVIGGIIKESDGEDVSGIPVLKDAPILGWLFKSKRKTHQKSELLIFLTPTVLPSPVKQY